MEEILVRKMMEDDMGAFDKLMSLYQEKALRMAYLISGNYADSEDIVQETFVTCWLCRKQIRNPELFSYWFYKTLTRTAWKICKKARREQPAEEIFEENIPEKASVLDDVVRQETSRKLYEAVKKLPIKQRTVIVLHYFNDMTTKEIAKVTGTLEGTVKSRLFTARESLRHTLGEEKEDEKSGEGNKKRAVRAGGNHGNIPTY